MVDQLKRRSRVRKSVENRQSESLTKRVRTTCCLLALNMTYLYYPAIEVHYPSDFGMVNVNISACSGPHQRWGIVRSTKRCRHCILGCSAYLRLESQNLTRSPFPPSSCGVYLQRTLYTEHCVKFWDSSFELVEHIKPKIKRRHIYADLAITHLSSWNCGLITSYGS
jgi:hypothetical protein